MRTRFEVTSLTADIAGEQPFTLDVHLTSCSERRRPVEVATVTLGALLIYCYDRASIRAFTEAWVSVLEVAHDSRALPELADFATGPGWDRHQASLILRVQGAPARPASINVIARGASLTGIPYAAVTLDRFTVHAYDLTSVRDWADGWVTAEATAHQIWPEPDTFDEAENRERARIARTGRPSQRGGAPRSY